MSVTFTVPHERFLDMLKIIVVMKLKKINKNKTSGVHGIHSGLQIKINIDTNSVDYTMGCII